MNINLSGNEYHIHLWKLHLSKNSCISHNKAVSKTEISSLTLILTEMFSHCYIWWLSESFKVSRELNLQLVGSLWDCLLEGSWHKGCVPSVGILARIYESFNENQEKPRTTRDPKVQPRIEPSNSHLLIWEDCES